MNGHISLAMMVSLKKWGLRNERRRGGEEETKRQSTDRKKDQISILSGRQSVEREDQRK